MVMGTVKLKIEADDDTVPFVDLPMGPNLVADGMPLRSCSKLFARVQHDASFLPIEIRESKRASNRRILAEEGGTDRWPHFGSILACSRGASWCAEFGKVSAAQLLNIVPPIESVRMAFGVHHEKYERGTLMSRKSMTNGPQARETIFRVHAPGARSVCLAGTFNDWDPATHSMEEEAGGDWVLAVLIEPGRHEYKFIVDGVWCCDPAADDAAVPVCVPNGVGSHNLSLEVPGSSGDS